MKPSAIDFKNFSFSTPRAMGDSGAKMLYVNYDGKPFSIQMPEMAVGWDIKYYADPKDVTTGKYQVSLKFDSQDSKHNEAHEFFDKMDKLLLEACYENRVNWLKKPSIKKEIIKEFYTPLIKRSIDKETGEVNGKYPDEFRIKLVKREGVYLFKLFDDNKSMIDTTGEEFVLEEIIKQRSKFKGIITCNGVWISGGKFGCTWKGSQIKVETPMGMADYAFEDTDSDCDEAGPASSSESDSDSE